MQASLRTAPESDAFLAALVNSSSDAIISKDLSGTILSWNKGAERIFGYTAEEAVGQPITIIFLPDRFNEEPEIMARIRHGEVIEHYDTVRRRKDGTLVDISLTVSPVYDAQGRIIAASKVARDISARKREQERLWVTFSSIGDAIMSTDERGLVTFMNRVAEELTGWRSAEARGRPLGEVFQIIDENTRQPLESLADRVLREGRAVALPNSTLLVSRRGTECPIDDSASPIRDRNGRLSGVVVIFRDTTERREADLAVRRLAAIVEGSDDAIVGKNLQGIVTSWNPGAERVFGYTAAEMIGQSITKLIPGDRLQEEQTILSRLQRGERMDHIETVRRRKDGTLIDVSLTISPIRDQDGHIVGASKIARDVTNLKRAQESLQAHTAELEEKVRERTASLEDMVQELEAFSYSLSHDMRAPVRAIQSYTEIVLQDLGPKIPEGIEYLERVISAANRMDRLIQDVLSFTRLSRAEISLAPVDVEKLVDALVRERPEFQEPQAEVRVRRPLQRVRGHDAALTQCLSNLLGNAVKFVKPGAKPQAEIYTEAAGGRVRLCVRDQGIGVRPEFRERLFALFQRLHPQGRYEGTGIGLAIVRKAAERMRGSVGLASDGEGRGTVFWVELDRA